MAIRLTGFASPCAAVDGSKNQDLDLKPWFMRYTTVKCFHGEEFMVGVAVRFVARFFETLKRSDLLSRHIAMALIVGAVA